MKLFILLFGNGSPLGDRLCCLPRHASLRRTKSTPPVGNGSSLGDRLCCLPRHASLRRTKSTPPVGNGSSLGDRLCCLPRRFPLTYGKVRLPSVNRKSSSSAPRLSSKGLAVTGERVVTLFVVILSMIVVILSMNTQVLASVTDKQKRNDDPMISNINDDSTAEGRASPLLCDSCRYAQTGPRQGGGLEVSTNQRSQIPGDPAKPSTDSKSSEITK